MKKEIFEKLYFELAHRLCKLGFSNCEDKDCIVHTKEAKEIVNSSYERGN